MPEAPVRIRDLPAITTKLMRQLNPYGNEPEAPAEPELGAALCRFNNADYGFDDQNNTLQNAVGQILFRPLSNGEVLLEMNSFVFNHRGELLTVVEPIPSDEGDIFRMRPATDLENRVFGALIAHGHAIDFTTYKELYITVEQVRKSNIRLSPENVWLCGDYAAAIIPHNPELSAAQIPGYSDAEYDDRVRAELVYRVPLTQADVQEGRTYTREFTVRRVLLDEDYQPLEAVDEIPTFEYDICYDERVPRSSIDFDIEVLNYITGRSVIDQQGATYTFEEKTNQFVNEDLGIRFDADRISEIYQTGGTVVLEDLGLELTAIGQNEDGPYRLAGVPEADDALANPIGIELTRMRE